MRPTEKAWPVKLRRPSRTTSTTFDSSPRYRFVFLRALFYYGRLAHVRVSCAQVFLEPLRKELESKDEALEGFKGVFADIQVCALFGGTTAV